MKEKSKEERGGEKRSEKTITINIWMLSTILLAIITVAIFFFRPSVGATGYNILSPQDASNKAIKWIESYFKANGIDATLTLVNASESESGLYQFTVKISVGGREDTYTYFVSKDGKYFIPQAISTEELLSVEEENRTEEIVEKKEKPEANVFIMSHCPYGVQFLKAYVQVMEVFKDKASLNINFVNYIMHGKEELDDNLVIYCIQKEQRDKLTRFIRCFVESGNSTKCVNETNIDKNKLNSCIAATDEKFNITKLYNDKSTWLNGRFPRFPVDDELVNKYNVGGSPTFVVNGKEVSVSRSANAIKEVICSAFINPPDECNFTMSTVVESPGFGPIGKSSGSSGSAQCG
ncbi:MAG: hypothetical protein QW758_01515 [Candidatus Aenigmatarchaeota archaeon]